MSVVGAFDVHRRQITFDYLDTDTGQVARGRIAPACRELLRRCLAQRFAARTDVGSRWRRARALHRGELEHAGIEAWLAEPADTAAARGRKRRARTDPADAQHVRELLAAGRLPTSWLPPEQVRESKAIRPRPRVQVVGQVWRSTWTRGRGPAGAACAPGGRASSVLP
jgi:hypothetical protein